MRGKCGHVAGHAVDRTQPSMRPALCAREMESRRLRRTKASVPSMRPALCAREMWAQLILDGRKTFPSMRPALCAREMLIQRDKQLVAESNLQ